MEIRIRVNTHYQLSLREFKRAGLHLNRLKRAFTIPNPEFFKKSQMGFYTGTTTRTLTLLQVDGDSLRVPRGGWVDLERVLAEEGVSPVIVDETIHGTGPTGLTYTEPREWRLGADQHRAIRGLIAGRQGILHAPCGSGKTEILLKVIADLGERTLVLVHTERILADWVRSIHDRLGVPEKDIGILSGKCKRVGVVTVGMVKTILNLLITPGGNAFARQWGAVVQDEVHHVAAATLTAVLERIPARYRLGATATIKRKDGKESLVYDVFGAVYHHRKSGGEVRGPRILHRITDEDLDRYGRIVPVDLRIVRTDFEFDLDRERELSAEGFERGVRETWTAAVRRWAKENKYYGTLNTYGEMLDAMTADPARRALILSYLVPEIQGGRTCLVLADRREMCIEIQAWLRRSGIECGRLMGGKDAKEQDRVCEGLKNRSLRVAVGTTVADEGMSINTLDRGFALTPVAGNPGRLLQQMGRIKRLCAGKADAVYYYFWDHRIRALRTHARAIYQTVRAPHSVSLVIAPGEWMSMTAETLKELEARE